MPPLTPDEARQQLSEADSLGSSTNADARIGALTTAGVGLLIGVALAISFAFNHHRPAALALSFAAYGLALTLLMTWHRKHFRVATRGWGRLYTASFLATMLLYVVGIGWVVAGSFSWLVVGPYCLLVAVPMLVAAARMARR
jgi:hypothetical protein